MLGMMESHDLFGNIGFECLPSTLAESPLPYIAICYIVSVWELRKGEFGRAHLGFCVSRQIIERTVKTKGTDAVNKFGGRGIRN
jgi:hypothetical protein